jgi:hypothetical protein
VEDDSLARRIAYRRLDLRRDDLAAGSDTALECDLGTCGMNLFCRLRQSLDPAGRFLTVDGSDRLGVDPSLLFLAHAFRVSLDNPDCSAPKAPELYALLSESGFQSARVGRQPNGMPLIGAER